MKLVSFDLETTGLDPKEDQVLHCAAVIENTEHPEVPVEELPTFERLIKRDRVSGHPIAMAMNHELLKVIGNSKVVSHGQRITYRGREVGITFDDAGAQPLWECHLQIWLLEVFNERNDGPEIRNFTLLGKNVASFDYQFLSPTTQKNFHHRICDVGNVAMGTNADLWQRDRLPSMTDLDFEPIHDALDDARDSIKALRQLTKNYGRDA